MKRALFLSVLIMFGGLPLLSQNGKTNGNPFAGTGIRASVATFGDNPEFHDRSRVVEIGSVLFDTKTGEMVGFADETKPGIAPDVTSMSIDPNCEKYYSVSPYAYCLNNPIKFIDPDGRDVWEINNEGRVVNRIKDKTQDSFFMVAQNENGEYERTFTTDEDGNKQYNSVSFDYGTIESQKSISYSLDGKVDTYDEYKVRGDQNGSALFEFMGKNVTGSSSMVEVGLAQTGVKGEKGLNFITTGHIAGKEPGGSYIMSDRLYYGYSTRSLIHSHPKSDNPSGADKDYKSQVIGVMRQQGLQIPSFGIYHVKTNRYIYF